MTRPARKGDVAKQVELTPIHDFASKLLQPELLPRLKEYVLWSSKAREAERKGESRGDATPLPDRAPVSINLDLTTACNYACDHCVDMDILNTGIRYDHERLKASLVQLAARGLRSVILIGGGEPTVYPRFAEIVHLLKDRNVQVSIVSNGSGNEKILEVADRFDELDWVRLSLDSGTDETFQAMHKPRKPITLDRICEGIPPIKAKNPKFPVGFSYIVVWKDAHINDATIVENIHEIPIAAERAKKYGFDYIAIKPFLVRAAENNAEIVDLDDRRSDFPEIAERIRRAVREAKAFEDAKFRVYETTNLKVLYNGTYRDYQDQPKRCHMQFFRQVVSPLGLYNCPVYRNVEHARIGDKHGYGDPDATKQALSGTRDLIRTFDASRECKEVTCLYNHVNWFIEDLIESPEKLRSLQPSEDRRDYFL